jgi:hypothetical protein
MFLLNPESEQGRTASGVGHWRKERKYNMGGARPGLLNGHRIYDPLNW